MTSTAKVQKMSVYIIQSKQFFKIGKSNSPTSRMFDIQIGNPIKMILIAEKDCKNDLDVERELHEKLKKYKVRGEWFLLSISQINKIMVEYGFKRTKTNFQKIDPQSYVEEIENRIRREIEEQTVIARSDEIITNHLKKERERLDDAIMLCENEAKILAIERRRIRPY